MRQLVYISTIELTLFNIQFSFNNYRYNLIKLEIRMKFHIIALCALSLLLFSCTLKKEEMVETPAQLKKVPFTPQSDSSITIDQMRKWLSCNKRLDSLSFTFLDLFKTDDSELRLQYQQNFIAAQDMICVQQGLTGGYEEYVWILRNSGNRKNKKVLESLNLTPY